MVSGLFWLNGHEYIETFQILGPTLRVCRGGSFFNSLSKHVTRIGSNQRLKMP